MRATEYWRERCRGLCCSCFLPWRSNWPISNSTRAGFSILYPIWDIQVISLDITLTNCSVVVLLCQKRTESSCFEIVLLLNLSCFSWRVFVLLHVTNCWWKRKLQLSTQTILDFIFFLGYIKLAKDLDYKLYKPFKMLTMRKLDSLNMSFGLIYL